MEGALGSFSRFLQRSSGTFAIDLFIDARLHKAVFQVETPF
jgi:hypothetical protein